MCKTTQMNAAIFEENLKKVVAKIKRENDLSDRVDKFLIVPIEEVGNMLDGGDEMMKRLVLSEENIGEKKLLLKEVVEVLGCLFPRAPVWINVSFVEMEENTCLFKLETSIRFRKPSLLRNSETGHAPFKVVL